MTKTASDRSATTLQKIPWEAFVRSFAWQLLKCRTQPETLEGVLKLLNLGGSAARRPFMILDHFVRLVIAAYRGHRPAIHRLKRVADLLDLGEEFPRLISGLVHCPVSTYHGTWEDFERILQGQMNDQTYARVRGSMAYNYLWFFYVLNPTRYFYFDKQIIKWINLNYRTAFEIDFPTLKSYAVRGLEVGAVTKLSSAKIVDSTYLTALQRPPELTYRALPGRASNTIFYGPSATGKTDRMIRHALHIIESHQPSALANLDMTDEEKFNHYRRLGRIEFVSLHQQSSYEHLVEGLPSGQGGPVQAVREGIFKRLCRVARNSLILNNADQVNYNGRIWVFDQDVRSKRRARQYLSDHPELRRTIPGDSSNNFRPGDLLLGIDEQRLLNVSLIADFQENRPRLLEESQEELRFHLHPIAREVYLPVTLINEQIYMFDQSSFGLLDGFQVEDILALLKSNNIELQGASWMDAPYVFIMDNLQNASVSSVLGDLLPLLEPNRRLGEAQEVTVRLPISKEIFGIPSNVHLLGALNTSSAARTNLAALDATFRHACEFVELKPDPACLARLNVGVNLPLLLHVINRRLELLLGHQYTVGHGYLTDLHEDSPLPELRRAMEYQIIPLLEQYTGNDLNLLARVLGVNPDASGQLIRRSSAGRYLGSEPDGESVSLLQLHPNALSDVTTYQHIYQGFTEADLPAN